MTTEKKEKEAFPDLCDKQRERGYKDAIAGNAFGHSNESGTWHADVEAAYRQGWEQGRTKKHGKDSFSK